VTAFDAHRPPSRADLDACVHCGFCLPACPTYVLGGEEMDSPRGRIVLMAAAHEADALSDAMALHWDRCLGCLACVTACPSGVAYDRLIADTRPQLERNRRRPLGQRLLRRTAFGTLTHRGRLRALAPLARAGGALGARRVGRRLSDRSRLGAVLRLTPRGRPRASVPPLTDAAGERRGRAALLTGCVQSAFFSGVNAATAEVLAAEGWEVERLDRPRCCGALQLHSGAEEDGLRLMRELVEAAGHADVVVANAAGCGSAMKEAGRLLAGDPAWAARAASFSARVRDVTELLAAAEPRAPLGPVPLRAVYHDACHLAHGQGLRAEPRLLLARIPGLELVEPDERDLCCGSAGLYNLLEPETAAALGRRKAAALLATGADAIVAANPGCTLQLETYLEEAGRPLDVVHPVELLQRSLLAADAGGNRRSPEPRALSS
jgi:glycolate oxidase iron-sulfur subunit